MENGQRYRLTIAACFLAGSYFTCSVVSGIAQTGGVSIAGVNGEAQAFEVVSIKANKSGTTDTSTQGLPDGFRDVNIVLATLVREAYGMNSRQVVGMPSWARSERYDVEARVNSDTVESWSKLSWKERSRQEQPMLQAMLAERCLLKVHHEVRKLPVYNLIVARGGLKMKEAAPAEPSSGDAQEGKLVMRAVGIESLIGNLSGTDGRLVLDKTELSGKKFDFDLTWTPDNRQSTVDSGPSLFTALEEQLGLRLAPSSEAVDVLVIDYMERPSPN